MEKFSGEWSFENSFKAFTYDRHYRYVRPSLLHGNMFDF